VTPRSRLSRLRLPALLAVAAGCAQPPAAPPVAAPPAADVRSENETRSAGAAHPLDPAATDRVLRPALRRLDEALALRHRNEQWEQVAETAREAAALLDEAREAGARGPAADAAHAAVEALLAWQALGEAGDPARAECSAALLRLLDLVGRQVPQTHALRAVILLETGRDAEAGAELLAGLQQFPAYPELHDLARGAADRLPGPQALAKVVDQAAARRPELLGEAAATRGYLLLAAGIPAERDGNPAGAARLYELGAEALRQAREDESQRLSDWTLAQRRADCLANAGRLHLQRAQDLLAAMGLPAARPELAAAEQDYGDALEAVPDDEESHAGLAATADTYYQAGDLDGVRDAFGRLAARFDDAEWWNNHAFFCRETGLYEESFAAYEKCVALEPWNARYVNDTALILLYHLDRDLDRAEAMFRKAIELGRTACDNPFIDEASREANFGAYTDAMLNLSLLLARDGRLDEAETLANELLVLSPERADARGLLAHIEAARRGEPVPRNP